MGCMRRQSLTRGAPRCPCRQFIKDEPVGEVLSFHGPDYLPSAEPEPEEYDQVSAALGDLLRRGLIAAWQRTPGGWQLTANSD
jgi:hypothetical protein